MSLNKDSLRVLVAVGSRSDRVCSIGSFARAEAKALEEQGFELQVLEPTIKDRYPLVTGIANPDIILFHAPSLHDRIRPWNALKSALQLRVAFPKARLISVVHEFSEAPWHWKARQIALLRLSHGVVVNSEPDLRGVQLFHHNILRARLGPTLFRPDLTEKTIERARNVDRTKLAEKFGLPVNSQWVLHPGLFTPGKGINFLQRFAPLLSEADQMILIGSTGPKERDKQFAEQTFLTLRAVLGKRLVVIDSPTDEVFKEFLLAADLVVLPYDVGVSERRSSFLAAASCGANIWTTIGEFSKPLELERSGTYVSPINDWENKTENVLTTLQNALSETESSVTRRVKNLQWAVGRSWSARVTLLEEFFRRVRK